jgi:hypothetical protein
MIEMNDMIWHKWHDLAQMAWFGTNGMIWRKWHELT